MNQIVYFKNTVVRGFGRGSKELGCPTANVDKADSLKIPTGIYCGLAQLVIKSKEEIQPEPGFQAVYDSIVEKLPVVSPVRGMVASFGFNPQYGNTNKSLEVHILDNFKFNFYGAELRVMIGKKMRDEEKYNSLDELKAAIANDIKNAKLEVQNYGNHAKNLLCFRKPTGDTSLFSSECTVTSADEKIRSSGDSDIKSSLDTCLQPTPAKQLFTQSPLLSIESLIKKKISNGAHALHNNIGPTWFRALQDEFDKPYFKELSSFVQRARQSGIVYPSPDHVYSWTHHHPMSMTKVVILGQDPYHGPGQAHGLSFSVKKGVPIPRSLQNIYKELISDIPNFKRPSHGELTGWAKQGVLLLNTCLTVNAGNANSHSKKGWEKFTDAVITWISKNTKHKVAFLLWGRNAQQKSTLIDKRHKILTAAHPSPLSADTGFFGCKHFSQTNSFLKSQNLPEIDWSSL